MSFPHLFYADGLRSLIEDLRYDYDYEPLPDAGWQRLGWKLETAVWGEYVEAESGATYRPGVELCLPLLPDSACACDCDSDITPCPHAVDLLELLAEEPGRFAVGSPVPVALAARLQESEAGRQAQAQMPPPPAPTLLKQLITAPPKRLEGMAAGAAELAAWLEDQATAGLAGPGAPTAAAWEQQAARLADHQLPGLASRLRALAAALPASADVAPLLAGLGELYGLAQALQRLDLLGTEARAEVLQQAGVTVQAAKLLEALEPFVDEWQVLQQVHVAPEQITAHRAWLYGRRSQRYALVLHYSSHTSNVCQEMSQTGLFIGPLVYYPGALPQRAVLGSCYGTEDDVPTAPVATTIEALLADYAQALGRNPWLRTWPATLGGVVPARLPDGRWALQAPAEGVALPLLVLPDAAFPYFDNVGLDTLAHLIALSDGGRAVRVFGEWDGQWFHPLRAWADADAPPFAPPAKTAPLPARLELPPPARPWGGPWAALSQLAAVGTRQGGVLPVLPGPVPTGTPAQQLLQAAGTAAVLHKAGLRPLTDAHPLAPLPPAARPPLPAFVTDALLGLENSNYEGMADAFLQRARAAGVRLPPVAESRLVNHGWLYPKLALDAPELLGPLGAWLQRVRTKPYIPDRPLVPEPAALADWAWATPAAVAQAVAKLRAADPAGSRLLLGEHLPGLPLPTLAAVLPELQTGLAAADEPLLESLLTANLQGVRNLVVRLLVQLPGSALLTRLWARAAPLLAVQRAPGSPPQLLLALPAKWDASWEADGIEQPRAHRVAERAPELLGNMLALVPPQRWLDYLGMSAPELVAAATGTEHALLLACSWQQASQLHHDRTFALALLRAALAYAFSHDFAPGSLSQLFDNDERARLLLHTPPAEQAPGEVPYLLAGYAGLWPDALADLALRYLAEVLLPQPHEDIQHSHHGLQPALYRSLPDAYLEPASALLRSLREFSQTQVADDRRHTLTGLYLRQELAASLAGHT